MLVTVLPLTRQSVTVAFELISIMPAPAATTWLSSIVHSLMVGEEDEHMIAPPQPPVVELSVSSHPVISPPLLSSEMPAPLPDTMLEWIVQSVIVAVPPDQ